MKDKKRFFDRKEKQAEHSILNKRKGIRDKKYYLELDDEMNVVDKFIDKRVLDNLLNGK